MKKLIIELSVYSIKFIMIIIIITIMASSSSASADGKSADINIDINTMSKSELMALKSKLVNEYEVINTKRIGVGWKLQLLDEQKALENAKSEFVRQSNIRMITDLTHRLSRFNDDHPDITFSDDLTRDKEQAIIQIQRIKAQLGRIQHRLTELDIEEQRKKEQSASKL